MTIRTSGIKSAQTELDRLMRGVVVESEQMMNVMLMGIAANTAPYVPVNTSALINSEFRRIHKEKTRRFFGLTAATEIVGEIGYGEPGSRNPESGTPVHEYAVYVHDGPQRNWQKPGASNQFLTKGVRDFIRDDLSGIIARYSR